MLQKMHDLDYFGTGPYLEVEWHAPCTYLGVLWHQRPTTTLKETA